jgi:hypothetical protein
LRWLATHSASPGVGGGTSVTISVSISVQRNATCSVQALAEFRR